MHAKSANYETLNSGFENHQKKITVTCIKIITVIAEGSRDGNSKKYRVVGMITNRTGIPTSHVHSAHAQAHFI